ncbi:LysR family transcriptional regulator [Kineococcus gynurae]|uniref:LysR family transcriptional regulator n=1 Tax=Kineococcus gynurae TaxID=452979 RepID=A0ABV5LW50_9ACTN
MDLRQLAYVVALADERHFTRAAALSGVSQSGLSAAIRTLETELGTELFHRTSRRVEPTPAGLALLPHARELLARAGTARDAVVQATQALSGSLRVGAEQCLGLLDVSSALERFHRRHPEVEITFRQAGSHALLELVRDGELDLAVVATTEHLGALPRTEVGREPLILLTPPGHPLAARAEVGWDDLADRAFIDVDPSWAMRTVADAACAGAGIHRRVRFTVGDVHTLLDLIGRGLGTAIVPRHVGQKPQAAGLGRVALPPDAPEWVVSLVVDPRGRSAPTRHLLDLLDPGALEPTG